jgi:DNA-binding transcriptional ArsR family regulator
MPHLIGRSDESGSEDLMTLNIEQLQDNARRASTLLKAMSNEHRLLILCQLSKTEKSVGELERLIGLSQSALSQHLARLRRDDLVQTRRSAQTIFYSLKGPEAETVISTLYELYCAPSAADQNSEGRLKTAAC